MTHEIPRIAACSDCTAWSSVGRSLAKISRIASTPFCGPPQYQFLGSLAPLSPSIAFRAVGQKLHPAYLFQVKTPAESKGKDDLYKLVATVPGEQAFRPVKDGHCPYIK